LFSVETKISLLILKKHLFFFCLKEIAMNELTIDLKEKVVSEVKEFVQAKMINFQLIGRLWFLESNEIQTSKFQFYLNHESLLTL